MNPEVLLLIPSYNHARFLPQLFASIEAQEYDNLTVIFSDDCSTDDSMEVIREFLVSTSYLKNPLDTKVCFNSKAKWEFYTQHKNLGANKNCLYLYNKVKEIG